MFGRVDGRKYHQCTAWSGIGLRNAYQAARAGNHGLDSKEKTRERRRMLKVSINTASMPQGFSRSNNKRRQANPSIELRRSCGSCADSESFAKYRADPDTVTTTLEIRVLGLRVRNFPMPEMSAPLKFRHRWNDVTIMLGRTYAKVVAG